MQTNYPLGDFLIRLKNAALAGHKEVIAPKTKLLVAVSEVLKKSGHLSSVEVKDNNIHVKLAMKSKKSVLMNVKLISKLGLRIYQGADEIKAHRGSSILIISTPNGMLSSKDAVAQNVGGEVIAEIW